MKKQLLFLFVTIISYNALNSADIAPSVPIDMPERYATEVKNPALSQIDSYIDSKKRKIDEIIKKNPNVDWRATYDDPTYWSTLRRAGEYIKKRAAEDPQFLAKAKNMEPESLRESPVMLEIYNALGMPHKTKEELDQNMHQRIAIADMIYNLNDNVRQKEQELADKLNVPLSAVSQPGIKVPEQGMLSRAIAYLSNLFGFNKKAVEAKSIAPSPQFTTAEKPQTTQSFWQKLRPASFKQMREQASEAKFREYKPAESTKKELKQMDFFGTGGYQY